MTLSPYPSEALIQRWFDNQVTSDEKSKWQAFFESEDGIKALASHHAVRDALVAHFDLAASRIDADALFANINRAITLQATPVPAAKPRQGITIGEYLRQTWQRPWVWAAAGATAALLVWMSLPNAKPIPAAPTEDPSAEIAANLVEPAFGSEIEEIDFGDGSGSVFELEGESGQTISVVWIDDEETI